MSVPHYTAIKAPPQKKSYSQLLLIASTALRESEDVFMFPSVTDENKIWHTNYKLKTCRDQDGNGCPALYYFRLCKHLEAIDVILDMLKRWEIPAEI